MIETAEQCWSKLSGLRSSMMLRLENYAALTIPKLLLPEGFDQMSTDQAHDYQSVGAQGTNHLTNKIMLALFRPSNPFFRVQPGEATLKTLAAQGIDDTALAPVLSKIERDAVRELDARAQRPKLYTIIRHLIVLGNVLMCLHKDTIRVMGIRYWCVKRDVMGRVLTLIIRECVKFDELDQKAQEFLAGKYQPDQEVKHYRYIKRQPNGDYVMTQWVDSHELPSTFTSKWPEDKMPYRVLTWDLADEADYGTGLVEEYVGDLEACSTLSESTVDGAVLGAEVRWVANPSGQTSVDDVQKSETGDVLAGSKDDLVPITADNARSIEIAEKVNNKYERRLGQGFLLHSAVTRDAERVTAEEVRMTANELETAFGGVYSQLANGLQRPIAMWLLEAVDVSIDGADLEVVIVTGLDALSRNSDMEALSQALARLGAVTNLPEGLQVRLKWKPLTDFIGQGYGVDLSKFVMDENEYAEKVAAERQALVEQEAATAGGVAAAEQATNPQGTA